ncbi:rhodanese-like domain-containing protein [Winogradskyella psychrotolerans]|uniref:rhodanese-like domain-containing protein n=1 Tax=Winogradskyella psychrotolerans TaxID=1344585 RepID=UPI001C0666AD|nr:rhodanese-like domain-containing protein [Winogradskyella psychrotolerans]MBU2928935.1 rhodanese-like domain-containing protein [Winogradskyella psychrotolerans]
MKTSYILISIILTVVMLFFVFNRIYRYNTIDHGLRKKIIKGAIILDVRTDSEYNKGHIEGSINMSLGTIRERYIELDSTKIYITYCSHGLRSVKVKNILKDKGFKKVFNGGAMSDLLTIIQKISLKE